MAYIEIVKGAYKSPQSIYNVIHYIVNTRKNPNGITNVKDSSESNIRKIAHLFLEEQKYWRKESGKRIRHFHVDFPPDTKLSYKDYCYIAYCIMDYFEDYQIIFALHEFDNEGNPCHKHLHFAFNPINYRNGKRFHLNKKQLKEFREYINDILSSYGITLETGIQNYQPE